MVEECWASLGSGGLTLSKQFLTVSEAVLVKEIVESAGDCSSQYCHDQEKRAVSTAKNQAKQALGLLTGTFDLCS